MPMLQAVTQMHHPHQTGMGIMQPHSTGMEYMNHQGPVDPQLHLQQNMQQAMQPDLSAEVPRKRSRKRDEIDPNKYALFSLLTVPLTHVARCE